MADPQRAEVTPLPVQHRNPDPTKAKPRRLTLRVYLSRIRAMLRAMAFQGGGFFTQYAYMSDLQDVKGPYPAIEELCGASPFEAMLAEMEGHLATFRSFGQAPTDPVLGRGMFPVLDAMSTYTAVRRFKPRRIVEIGSGDSTYFLAKGVKDNGFGHITCIDPQPRREVVALDVDFKPRLLNDGDADLAALLEAGDILFIDSSHIMLPGMDVDIQFNRMFPRLKPGVIVHVHDIFLPDDYPPHWKIRNYSEQNALIGWLVSRYFDIIWPGRYVVTRHQDKIQRSFHGFDLTDGNAGSLWLQRSTRLGQEGPILVTGASPFRQSQIG